MVAADAIDADVDAVVGAIDVAAMACLYITSNEHVQVRSIFCINAFFSQNQDCTSNGSV